MASPKFTRADSCPISEFRDLVLRKNKSSEKRVVFALPAWNISGVNTFVENLIDELNNIGYSAEILFTTRDSSRVESEHMPRVPHRYLTTKTLSPTAQRKRVAEYLRLNSPCVFVPNYDYIASSVAPDLPPDVGVLGVLHCDDDEHYVHAYQMGPFWNAIVAVGDTIREKNGPTQPGL